MRICDLHCDTITACMKKGEAISNATGHISLKQANVLEEWIQVFAIFVPDRLRGIAAAAYCDKALCYYESQREMISQVCKPILALENGAALNGDLQKLDQLARSGVKVITLTWDGANELGSGARCDSMQGLTAFGKRAVERMHELSIIPDVSHLNLAGFADVVRMDGPFIASHSNCAAVWPHCRNLDDNQIKAIIAQKGLIGINFYPEFLGGAGTAEDLTRHLLHVIALGGGDRVALGSDFDGCTVHPSLDGLSKLPQLDADLAALGISIEQRKKFFWANGMNYLKKHLHCGK